MESLTRLDTSLLRSLDSLEIPETSGDGGPAAATRDFGTLFSVGSPDGGTGAGYGPDLMPARGVLASKGGRNKDTDTTDTSGPSKGGLGTSGYNIEIEFLGSWTDSLKQAFIDASEFISSLILGDVTDVLYNGEFIDDLSITAELTEIDGTNGILGRAGPTAYRGDSPLPATGLMEFDIADAEAFDARGLWDDIVFHEMMHCVGMGTLWSYMGLTNGSQTDLRFIGDNVVAAYEAAFGLTDSGGVPIEMDGGSGTAGGHWDEAVFGNEIMTGYINGSNYLSDVTVAALEDMGYDTVWDDVTTSTDLVGAMPTAEFLGGLVA